MIRAAALLMLLSAAPAAAQMNILGPCREGHRWMATTTSGAPIAAYATCEGSQPLVIVACGAGGWPELRFAAAPGAPIPQAGEAATALLTIDGGAPFELRLAPGATIGGGSRILRVQLTRPAVDAMSRGARAAFEMLGTRFEMHLGASFDVLTLFNQQC